MAAPVFYIFDAVSNLPLANVRLDFASSNGVQPSAVTDSLGVAHLQLLPGPRTLRARRLAFKEYTVEVDVRPGTADTLKLGLGREHICFL